MISKGGLLILICLYDSALHAISTNFLSCNGLGWFIMSKLGQALSTRPDILPIAYCQELSKLQDQIPPFPTRNAIRTIESELGSRMSDLFADISPEPIAATLLGQVYKAHLHSEELVAIKVQRPGMAPLLTLDALLFNMIGGQLKRFAKARKDLLARARAILLSQVGPLSKDVSKAPSQLEPPPIFYSSSTKLLQELLLT
ncbi:hypothetical protein ZWY2020_059702 [Hordeum vulgare]|nr:hypothetical protein ZWY2020_059702 [Hordeum vulgare]